MPRPLAYVSTLILWCALVGSAGAAAPVDSFDIAVPQAPVPLTVEGRQRLMYELHLTHFGRSELSLERLVVLNADGDTELAQWRGADLAARSRTIGRDSATLNAPIRPGERAVVYVEFDLSAAPPKQLRHRFEFASASGAATVIEGAAVSPGAAPRLQLGPPLRGGPWIAIYSTQWPRGHRRVFYTLDGRARLPGRHAIDWVKLDAQGNSHRGTRELPSDFLGYGEPVLAVADATVAAVRDGMAEAATVAGNPKHDFDQAPGNYVVLALGDGRYATYEHLRPGSIKVGQGDRVRLGQQIGELGFTGDSTGPHLHFHLADGSKPLSSEGVGYGLAGFRLLGHYARPDLLNKQVWDGLAEGVEPQRRNELPAANSVIEFPR
ncbi:M23 family metallopeptidase [Pseudomonas sp. CGJS7]|uniref:M23 family metallopeptidase n=1 Tax=Pseudomonas sp. CGJS7 TaxID=3109348 RepID=UPI00300A509A